VTATSFGASPNKYANKGLPVYCSTLLQQGSLQSSPLAHTRPHWHHAWLYVHFGHLTSYLTLLNDFETPPEVMKRVRHTYADCRKHGGDKLINERGGTPIALLSCGRGCW
jgi:hypothetical protein